MLEKLRNFLATQGQVKIIEDIIEPEIQFEYMEMASKLRDNIDIEQVEKESDNLFLDNFEDYYKKQLLVSMACIDDIYIYRKIESFSKKATGELKSWALMAFQESQTLIQSSLLEEKQILISSGLGGRDNKMRFFVIMQMLDKEKLTPQYVEIIKKEIDFAFSKTDCILESFEYQDFYCTITTLLPLEINIEEVFKTIVLECNNLGIKLSDIFTITNVKIYTLEETGKLIKELDEKAKYDNEDNEVLEKNDEGLQEIINTQTDKPIDLEELFNQFFLSKDDDNNYGEEDSFENFEEYNNLDDDDEDYGYEEDDDEDDYDDDYDVDDDDDDDDDGHEDESEDDLYDLF